MTTKDKVKFECDKCGCYFWVDDRNSFECPNCKQIKLEMEKEKDKIEIDIEGINAKELSQPAIDFYFNCSKEQRNILREYIAKSISQKQKIIEEIEKTSKRWYKIIKKNIKDKYWQSSELNLIQQIEKELLNSLGDKKQ